MTAFQTVPVVGHAATETETLPLATHDPTSIEEDNSKGLSMARAGMLDANALAALAYRVSPAMNGLIQTAAEGRLPGCSPANHIFLHIQLMLQQQQLMALMQVAHDSSKPPKAAPDSTKQQLRPTKHHPPPLSPSSRARLDSKRPRPPSPPWQRPPSPPLMFGRRVRLPARRVLNKPPSAPRTAEAAKNSAVGKLRTLVAAPSLRKNVLLRAILAKNGDADKL